jgi:hypothetical protein
MGSSVVALADGIGRLRPIVRKEPPLRAQRATLGANVRERPPSRSLSIVRYRPP